MNHTPTNGALSSGASARLSLSSWSLNNVLGAPPFFGVGGEPEYSPASLEDALPLIELPARLKDFGIGTLEICHFHLPSREPSYLHDLRNAIEDAGVELWSILIDDGDINHPEHAARDTQWIAGWIDVAGALGARNARVIAGKAEPSQESLARSHSNLQQLAAHAQSFGVHLMTENWYATLSRPELILQTLEALNGQLGLCVDFGNWGGDTKYDDLDAIMPHARSCHTKARFVDGHMEREDFVRCLELTRKHNFSGPHTLIYDSGGDEWQGLAAEREIVAQYL
jgi:sugar phosphate isomerase/epimerase